MNTSDFRPQLASLQRIALGMLVVGGVLCGIGLLTKPDWFLQSYLVAYMFWFGVTAGSLSLLMLHHVVGGGWGFIIRRLLEAATRLLPLMFVLFVPVLLGLHGLYSWDRPYAELDHTLQAKSIYLNANGFIIRWIIYYAIWMTLAFFLNKWSVDQDRTGDPEIYPRLTVLGAVGILLYVLSITFAVVDWVLSLTPHWTSSIVGLLFVAAQGLSTFALMHVLVAYLGSDRPPLNQIPQKYFRDLGNLTLAGVLLWSYLSFSQFLITYSGNTAEEAPFYVRRASYQWGIISLLLIVAHFVIPFLTLLSSSVKVKIQNLAKLALFLIFMRFVDLFWWVVPAFRTSLQVGFSDFGAPLLLGGVWLWAWSQVMKQERPLLPLHDPRLGDEWPPHDHHAPAGSAPLAHAAVNGPTTPAEVVGHG